MYCSIFNVPQFAFNINRQCYDSFIRMCLNFSPFRTWNCLNIAVTTLIHITLTLMITMHEKKYEKEDKESRTGKKAKRATHQRHGISNTTSRWLRCMTKKKHKANRGSYQSMCLVILNLSSWRRLIKTKLKTKYRRNMHMPIECSWNCQARFVRKYCVSGCLDTVHNKE